ncbi:hypothetical protein TIFTF001_000648 [Ficus carica]|uniref:Uncharacterized protein n=1 Tax=Ficus carica TaxID=3494 RepID=A0AA87YVR9_FICCA|nr:hypothetical protein TIFTF001_000648 [Ficus carica]
MDPHPTPFPGKTLPLKPKPNRKITEPSKPTSRDHVTCRQKRVFGTVQNANIPTRTVSEKPTIDKPLVGGPRKQPQRTRPARVPVETEAAKKENSLENPKPESNHKRVSVEEAAREKTPGVKPPIGVPRKQPQRTWPVRVPVTEAAKEENFPENTKPESNQKRVSIQVEAGEKTPVAKPSIGVPRKQSQRTVAARFRATEAAKKENSPEIPKPESNEKRVSLQELEESGEKTPFEKLRTPVIASPSLSQSKTAGSAYHSAKICSKCEFDRLETPSYWLAQIKLSESVGKHLVSAAFFKLALECKAEPIRKLRFELKRYLVRNGNLAGQTEWKEVCISYGILKEEKETESFDLAIRELGVPETTDVEPDQELPEDPEHHDSCLM